MLSQKKFYVLGLMLVFVGIFSVIIPGNFLLQVFADEERTEFLIASWNLKNFGKTRAANDKNLQAVSEILTGSKHKNLDYDFDIIFIQEIQSHGKAFDKLCNNYMKKLDYDCDRTEQFKHGTGANNEGYGVIWKNYLDVKVENTNNANVEPLIKQGKDNDQDQMIRPPMKATVTVWPNFDIIVYNNHIKPSSTEDDGSGHQTFDELDILQTAIIEHHGYDTEDYIVVLGDLNASCTYLKDGIENHPDLFPEDKWLNIFSDEVATNFAQKPCAYDKIIINENLIPFFYEESDDNFGAISTFPQTTKEFGVPLKVGGSHISDHQLVWA